jgi:Schlafen, AlbA_2
VPHASIRRLALADLDGEGLRRLIEHGEDLFVERKQQPPEGSGLGATVASFANTLGGWLILGVTQDREIVGYAPPERTDPQSHFGHVISNQVDPLPPFVAEVRELDGTQLTVVRVFESTDTPHVVMETGAVYIRDSRGKHPVEQDLLFQLARRGEEALKAAQGRFRSITEPLEELQRYHKEGVGLYGLAAPLTVTPQFSAWAISRAAVAACEELLRSLSDSGGADADLVIYPRARGFGVHRLVAPAASIAVDSGGVVGAHVAFAQPADGRVNAASLRTDHLLRVIEIGAEVLERAEAVGRVAWEFLIAAPTSVTLSTGEGLKPFPAPFYASRELSSPSSSDERETLSGEIVRELVRTTGVAEFELKRD